MPLRFFRSIFSSVFRRSQRLQTPKLLAPPSDSHLGGQFPSQEQMTRHLYARSIAQDVAATNRPWYRRMSGHPA